MSSCNLDACNSNLLSCQVVEVTNYRVTFMENSTGRVSEIAHGHILRLEEKASSLLSGTVSVCQHALCLLFLDSDIVGPVGK